MNKPKRSSNIIQSVDRAIQILECFSQQNKELGVTEISKILYLHKSTVFGILATLENRGYIEQNITNGKYRLGMKLLERGALVKDNIDLVEISRPYLDDLVKKYNETVHLVMNDKGQAVYIDKVEGNSSMRMYSQLGKRPPMYCTGVGKAILAFMPQEFIDNYLEHEKLTKFVPNTLISISDVNRELEKVRMQGYSLDNEEIEEGLKCVAAPIRDNSGNVVGALSVAGPAPRMTKDKIQELIIEIRKVALQISYKIGYRDSVR